MMKKIFTLILVVVMVTSFSGCILLAKPMIDSMRKNKEDRHAADSGMTGNAGNQSHR